jgi:homoserine dehydrogenase
MTQLTIAIAGLGTVGAATAKLLLEETELLAARTGRSIKLVAVSAKDKSKERGFSMQGLVWEDDPLALIPHADLIIELIGGAEGTARKLVEAALKAGKHVITANKALIAHHGLALATLAEEKGVSLRCEAAVAGAIPIISALGQGLAANRFTRLEGILNGTCNFILTTMEATGRSFDDVLAEAQVLGFAEADPSFDVDGTDTAHKLSILTSLAFGTQVSIEEVYCEGIRRITPADITYAHQLGYRIKLLGIAELTAQGIAQRVHPCLIPLEAPMAQVSAEFNAILVEGSASGKMILEGRGAGGHATASAVLSDVIDIARKNQRPTFTLPAKALAPLHASAMDQHQGCYYLRLSVRDEPGVLAAITTIFHTQNISVQSCIQQAAKPGKPVDLVITTHEARESAMQEALQKIAHLPSALAEPVLIRIEAS